MPNYTLYYFNSRGRAEICRMLFAAAGVHYNDRRIDYSEWNDFRSKMSGSVLPILEIDGKIQIPQSMAIARYLSREFGFHGRNNLEMARIDFISDCFYEILDDYLRLFHDKEGRIMYDQMSDMRTRYIDMDGKMTPIPVGSSASQSRGNSITSSGTPPGAYSDTYGSDASLDTKSSLYSEGRMDDSSSRGVQPDCYRTGIASESYPGSGRRHRDNTYIDGRMSEKRMRYMETCRRVLPFMEKTLEMQNGGHMFFCGEEMMMCDMMCFCALENPMMENSSFFNTYPRLMALRERVANEPRISKYIKRRYQSDF